MAIDNPKGLEIQAIFKPDMGRMVKALRILHEYRPDKFEEDINNKETQEKNTDKAS